MSRSITVLVPLGIAGILLAGRVAGVAAQRPERATLRALRADSTPVIVVTGTAEPTFRTRDAGSRPSALSPARKAEILSRALGLPVLVTGVGTGIRLTPSQPFAPGRARLEFAAAAVVLTDNQGGSARMISNPSIGLSSAVACSFWPTVVSQPLLIDVAISVIAIKSKARLRLTIPGGQFSQVVELSSGDHHLTAIYKPADLSEKSLVVEDAGADTSDVSFTFYACEITALVK